MRSYKDIELWKNVTYERWNDWHWQVRNRITTVEELKKIVNITDQEADDINQVLKNSEWELPLIMHPLWILKIPDVLLESRRFPLFTKLTIVKPIW